MRIHPNCVLRCAAVALAVQARGLVPDALMCELLAKPGRVAVTDETPEFSWGFRDSETGDVQTAYRLQVATTRERIEQNGPDLWDSGQVPSDQSLYVSYEGAPLPPGRCVYWRVCVWDRRQRQGEWSSPQPLLLAETLGADTPLRYPLVQQTIAPVRVVTNTAGHVFADFGKAAFGGIEWRLPEGSPSGPVILHLGEKADGDRVDAHPGGAIYYFKADGRLPSGPLRYRLPLPLEANVRHKGYDAVTVLKRIGLLEPVGVVAPFRYVEVEAAPFPVTADTLRQTAVHYPFDDGASSFTCDSAALCRVYDFCKYSIKATTFAGVYVDGDRERAPYEADAYINMLGHYGVDREFTMARFTHEYLMRCPTWPTEWKQHSVMMAWAEWMYTGNTEALERWYDVLKSKKVLAFRARETDGLLVTGGSEAPLSTGVRDITDWPPAERDGFEFRPVSAVVNAFYVRNLRQMADMAAALGRVGEGRDYREKAEQAARAYHALFFHSERGCYLDGEGASHASLHANMFPLAFGLVPPAERGRVADFVRSRGMACSVYGAQYLLEALFEAGMEDEAIRLMTDTGQRGWLNMMRVGSTITMEAWDMRFKSDLDWSHAWGAAPANIVPRFVLGVRPLLPGFKTLVLRPQIGSLSDAHGTVPTVRGAVSVDIRQKYGAWYRLTFRIPVNVTARVELPRRLTQGTCYLDGAPIDAEKADGQWVMDGVGSGAHTVCWQSGAENSKGKEHEHE